MIAEEGHMGLLSKLGELRMKDPVEGVLTIVSMSVPQPNATSSNYRLDGVVTATGLEATAVVHHGVCSISKWPSTGDKLKVTVDRAKPERLVVDWDSVPTNSSVARSAAEQLAEQMRAGGTSFTAPVAGGASLTDSIQAAVQQAVASVQTTYSTPTESPLVSPAPFVGNTDASIAPRTVTAADILARGTAGTAVVDAVFPSAEPCPKPQHTTVGLGITVSIPGQSAFQCKNLYAVPNDKVATLAAGITLPVKADLTMPGAVAVDWDAVQPS